MHLMNPVHTAPSDMVLLDNHYAGEGNSHKSPKNLLLVSIVSVKVVVTVGLMSNEC